MQPSHFVVGLSNGKGTPFFLCLLLINCKTMAKHNETSAPFVPHKLNAEETERMKAYLDVLGDRIELLECLDDNAYFFPDWLLKINEGIQMLIDYKQEKKIPCDEEKELLANIGYFFTKMAYFNGLITDWQRELTEEMELNKKMIDE
jgi:hypothetical protein